MTVDIVVPSLGESVIEATVAQWFKSVGGIVITMPGEMYWISIDNRA